MARPVRNSSSKAQSVQFHETLTPVVPYTPAAPTIPDVRAGIPDRYLKAGLYLVWALAAIFAGISIGMITIGNLGTVSTEQPVPIAKSTVKVADVSTPTLHTGVINPQSQPLKIATATSVYQAQAGNIIGSLSAGVLQPTSDTLQPGFAPNGFGQGKRGTAPVGQ